MTPRTALLAMTLLAAAIPAAAQPSAAGLPFGPAPIGHRVIATADASRAGRRIDIHVWYPARASTAPLTLGGYLSADEERRREQVADLATLTGRLFGPVPDGSIAAMLAAPMRATRDAAPAAAAAPLIVAQLRPLSNAHTFEVLASHGYVVGAVQYAPVDTGPGAPLEREGRSTDGQRRDLDVAIARLRQEPFVAPGPVGAFGFSGAGVPALALAAARDDVGAIALFETGWHGSLGSSLAAIPGFDPARVRAPLFFAWGAGMDAADAHLNDLRAMRASPKIIAWTRANGLTHWDFAAEGYLAAADAHWRAGDRAGVRAVFEEAHALLVAFFDRHLRSRSAAVAAPHFKLESLPSPGDPVGIWTGRATAGAQTTDMAIEVRALPGGLGLFLTLPPLHAYKMPVGYLKREPDHAWSIADWGITLRRQGSTLAGVLGDARVTFAVTPASADPYHEVLPAYPAGPPPEWRYDAGAPVWAGLAAHGNTIYAADTAGTVHALRAGDGVARWTRRGSAPIYAAPLAAAEAVFVADDAGVLRKLAAADGAEVWRVNLGSAMTSRTLPAETVFDFDYGAPAPVLDGDVIYLSSLAGAVHAIDAVTGAVRWRRDLNAPVRAAVAVGPRIVIVGTLDHQVIALDRATGAEAWRARLNGAITSAATIAGDIVVVGCRGAFLSGLDLATGRERWASSQWFSWVESTGVLADGLLYIGSSDLRMVRAIDPQTGASRWQTDVLGWAWGSPIVAGDSVFIGVAAPRTYVTRHEAGLVAIDRRTGRVQWRRPEPASATAFVSGFTGSGVRSGQVVAFPSVSGRIDGYALK